MHNTVTIFEKDYKGARNEPHKSMGGYSLVELSIALLIIGMIVGPSLYYYGLYKTNQKIKKTETVVSKATDEIGGFSSVYGYYPCPARLDANRSDPDYGYEYRDPVTNECLSSAGSVELSTSQNTSLTNSDILVGALPFRQMNLQESQAYDGYGNRVIYAVTDLLTDDLTFNVLEGGLSIVDLNGDSLLATPHTAGFAIMSMGSSHDGAFTRAGVRSGVCPATGPEAENCDFDEEFVVATKQSDFDDRLLYSTTIGITEWQISRFSDQNIHLRRASRVGLGDTTSVDMTTAQSLEILGNATDDGILTASTVAGSPPSGAVLSAEICDDDGANCFQALSVDSGGMLCPAGEYLVAIENEQPICEPEVFFSCPPGEFVAGFNAAGELVCNTEPPPGCPDATVTNSCGSNKNITGTYSGDHAFVFDGTCYEIDPLDISLISSMTTIEDIETYVDSINNSPRTAVDCGNDSTTALVRDTLMCDAGSWAIAPEALYERGDYNTTTWPSDPLPGPTNRSGEVGGALYDSTDPMSTDSHNLETDHDCWCREDYEVRRAGCRDSQTGNRVLIRQHVCPQTYHNDWINVYDDQTTFCDCVETTRMETEACHKYFGAGLGPNHVSGTVELYYDVACPDGPGGEPVVSSTPTTIDTSNCICPVKSPNPRQRTNNCPAGTTNSFIYDGKNYNGVSQIEEQVFTCPAGPPPQPVNSPADAGSWSGWNIVHTEACVCDSSYTKNEILACEDGLTGTGRTYEVEWDCTTGTWEDQSQWTLISDDCQSCRWVEPAGSPESSDYPIGDEKGDLCSCGSNGPCHESSGAGYDYWTNCSCTAH